MNKILHTLLLATSLTLSLASAQAIELKNGNDLQAGQTVQSGIKYGYPLLLPVGNWQVTEHDSFNTGAKSGPFGGTNTGGVQHVVQMSNPKTNVLLIVMGKETNTRWTFSTPVCAERKEALLQKANFERKGYQNPNCRFIEVLTPEKDGKGWKLEKDERNNVFSLTPPAAEEPGTQYLWLSVIYGSGQGIAGAAVGIPVELLGHQQGEVWNKKKLSEQQKATLAKLDAWLKQYEQRFIEGVDSSSSLFGSLPPAFEVPLPLEEVKTVAAPEKAVEVGSGKR